MLEGDAYSTVSLNKEVCIQFQGHLMNNGKVRSIIEAKLEERGMKLHKETCDEEGYHHRYKGWSKKVEGVSITAWGNISNTVQMNNFLVNLA